MTDTDIRSFRDAVTLLRQPGVRTYAALVIVGVWGLYALCFAVASGITTMAYDWMIRPAMTSLFGHEPMPTFVQLAVGVLVGAPLFYANVWLMNRAIRAWGVRYDRRNKVT